MDIASAIELMALIIVKKPLGAEWADHELSGNEWKGAREAHIGGDFFWTMMPMTTLSNSSGSAPIQSCSDDEKLGGRGQSH